MHDKTYNWLTKQGGGFEDILASIDWTTYRRIPWENNIPFFLIDFKNPSTNKPFHACSRSLLKRVAEQIEEFFRAQQVSPCAGAEYEWFNFLGTNKVPLSTYPLLYCYRDTSFAGEKKFCLS